MRSLSFYIGVIILFALSSCEQYELAPGLTKDLESQVAGLINVRNKKLSFEAPVAWAMVKNGKTEAT